MAELLISTLGPVRIARGDILLSGFVSDKARALLIYLAVEQTRSFRREALAALLWPEQLETRARANLRRALTSVRQVLDDHDGRYLLVTRQTLQFNGDGDAVVDAHRVEQLLGSGEPRLGELEEAVALVNGRFLEAFSIRESIAFEEWALFKRERLQRLFLLSLHRLTTYYETHHRPETAVRFAWRQVNTEPWYEPGQRQLLRLLARTGRRAAALTHYEQFRQALHDELRVMPEPATHSLYEQIRAGDLGPAPKKAAPPFLAIPRATAPSPFVAREQELDRLHDALRLAIGGQGQVVFISGEAGSGKSALLRAFAGQAQRRFPTLIPLPGECQARSGSGNPYLPFRTMVARALGDVEAQWRNDVLNREQVSRLWHLRGTAARLLRDEAPGLLAGFVDPVLLPETIRGAPAEKPPEQEILFRQLARFLRKLSEEGPLLLLLEDLQWADRGTVDLLSTLRQQLAGLSTLIIGTFRPEEVVTDRPRNERRHPLAPLLLALRRDLGDIEVDLNHSDGQAFVAAWLDLEPNRLDRDFRQSLYDRTQGHPLFTVELVAGLRAAGELFRDERGFWQARKKTSWRRLPARIEATIAERIARLPPPQRELLAAAAIQGERFSAEGAAHVLGRDLQETLRALSADLARVHQLVQVERRQQLGPQPLSWVRFRHQLFQQYLYDHLDPVERAELHRRTGDWLAQRVEAAGVDLLPVAAELAFHFEQAKNVARAAAFRQRAGEYALRLSAHAEAVDHYRRALALLESLPETAERTQREIECWLALGAALLPLQGYASAEVKRVYDRAHALCLKTAAAPALVTTLFWLTSYYAVSGELDRALTVAQQMLEITEREAVSDMDRMRAHVLTGLPLFFLGRNEEALDHFTQAVALYLPERHQPQVYTFGQDPGIAGMIWRGHVLLHLGRLAEAQHCLQQALDWTAALDHPYTHAFSQLLAGTAPNGWYLRRADESIRFARETIATAEKGRFTSMRAIGLFILGQVLESTQAHSGGDAARIRAEGFDLMRQGLELEKQIGSRLGLTSHLVQLADAYRRSGEWDRAWATVREIEREIAARQEHYFEPELLRVKGLLYRDEGRERLAETTWEQAIALARAQKAATWAFRATVDLCRLWHRQGKTELAQLRLADACRQVGDDFEGNDLRDARAFLNSLNVKEETGGTGRSSR